MVRVGHRLGTTPVMNLQARAAVATGMGTFGATGSTEVTPAGLRRELVRARYGEHAGPALRLTLRVPKLGLAGRGLSL